MIVCGFRTYWLLCLSSFLCFSIAKQGDRHHDVLKHGINSSASAFLNAEANLFHVLFHALKPLVGQLATGGSVETKDFGKLIHFYCAITNSIISEN